MGGHLLKRGAFLILCPIWWEVYSGRGAYKSVDAHSRKRGDGNADVVSNESFCFASQKNRVVKAELKKLRKEAKV